MELKDIFSDSSIKEYNKHSPGLIRRILGIGSVLAVFGLGTVVQDRATAALMILFATFAMTVVLINNYYKTRKAVTKYKANIAGSIFLALLFALAMAALFWVGNAG